MDDRAASARLSRSHASCTASSASLSDPSIRSDLVVRVDAAGATSGQPVEVRGARTWATGAVAFARAAQATQPALVDGSVGLVLAPGGRLSRVLSITIAGGRISQIDVIADPDRLRTLNLAVL